MALSRHIPVLADTLLPLLHLQAGDDVIDATVGAGEHADRLLAATAPHGRLLGLDQDPHMLALAQARLAPAADRVVLVQARFGTLGDSAHTAGFSAVAAVLFDLGVSSPQLDENRHGLSFRTEAPLDMRLFVATPSETAGPAVRRALTRVRALADLQQPVLRGRFTAADLLASLPTPVLIALLQTYGEEHAARRIVRAVLAARPQTPTTTIAFADLVRSAVPGAGKYRIDSATRTFQALRIAVNDELGELTQALPQAISLLKTGGVLAVISFHSLEDRLVKQFLRTESRDCICPSERPTCTCTHRAALRLPTRKPLRPTLAERHLNPRARSATLRLAEKI